MYENLVLLFFTCAFPFVRVCGFFLRDALSLLMYICEGCLHISCTTLLYNNNDNSLYADTPLKFIIEYMQGPWALKRVLEIIVHDSHSSVLFVVLLAGSQIVPLVVCWT